MIISLPNNRFAYITDSITAGPALTVWAVYNEGEDHSIASGIAESVEDAEQAARNIR